MTIAPSSTPPITALPVGQVLRGMGMVLFAVLVWSGWIIVSRVGVDGALTAYDITALRFGVAGLLLLPVLWRKGLRLGPWGIFGGLAIAALMGAPYNALAVLGMAYAPASHAGAVLNACMLCTTYLLGYYLLRERVGPMQLWGIVCCLAGIGCILSARLGESGHEHEWIGHLLFTVAGIMFGAYAALNKYWRLDPLHTTAAICVYSALFYLPVYLLWLPKGILQADMSEIALQAGYQGILNSLFALMAYNRGIAILGATRASAFIPLVPVISTLLAIPLLGEFPAPLEWAGVALVALGVLLACGILRILQLRRRSLAATPT